MPKQFVLKCTYGSSCNIICKDKSKLDISDAKIKINKWMKYNWFWFGREWLYKNVKPRIICEKFITDTKIKNKIINNGKKLEQIEIITIIKTEKYKI